MTKTNNVKVSVIIPVFNMEKYLVSCLESLVNQTLTELEIILINDCSTDLSTDICRKYKNNDSRIVLINNEKNLKQGLSRNKGIEIATGEFVGFVDPDDYIDFDFYEKLYNTAKSDNVNIAKAEVSKVYENGSIIPQPNLNINIRANHKIGDPLCTIFHYEHWAAIYKRNLIVDNNVGYADLRNAEDNIFLLKATFFLKSISVISGTSYYYRQHEQSTEATRKQDYYESILECFRFHMEFINARKLSKQLYDKIFLKGFDFARLRYLEITEYDTISDYSEEFFQKIMEISLQYKYDYENILKALHISSRYILTENEVSKSKIYFIAKFITWLPRKLNKLASSSSKANNT